jgi:hypothetical protein
MDDRHFDTLARRLAGSASRRAVTASLGGALAAVIGWIARLEIEARKKRQKKRKKKRTSAPRQICQTLREECSSAPEERCCGDLICSDNTCVGDPVCVQGNGGLCADTCDCLLGLECSDRGARKTCRQCVSLQNPCVSHDDCCLLTAACGSTSVSTGVCCQQLGGACAFASDCCLNTGNCGLDGCGGVAPVCCRGVGSQCESSCECCDPLRCLSGTSGTKTCQ